MPDSTPTLADLIEQAADISSLDDEALAQLDTDISEAAEAIAGGDVNAEELAELQAAGAAVQAIRAEQETRETAAAELRAEADAALAAIRGEQDSDTGDDGEDDEEAEPEAEPEAEAVDETPEVEAVVEDIVPEELPVAAAAHPLRRKAKTALATRRPSSSAPRPAEAPDVFAGMSLVASANGTGMTPGAPIRDYDQLAAAFISAYETTQGYRQGPRVKVPVLRIGKGETQYPEQFRLGDGISENMRKIDQSQKFIQAQGGVPQAITASQSLTATGGICAPQQVNYDMPTVGSTARPVRDQFMTRFGADRGGVRTIPMPLLGELDGAIDNWTEANDITPSDPTVKPCLTVTCPDEDETIVQAITRCLEYGNFRARFFPEQIEAWMRLAAVTQARFAEQALLTALTAGSTAVTVGQVLGTSRTILAGLDRSISVWKYRHRLDDGFALNWAAPRWLKDQIRTDIARQLPVGSTAETLAVADAEMERWFAVRNVNPVWMLDGLSGQGFAAQGVGPVAGWPSTVVTFLAPAGAWLFLDGGTLDLGLVRDSTLNSTNDVQVFAETFEGAHFHGIDSWKVTFDTCPDGSTSATIDIDPCSTGS